MDSPTSCFGGVHSWWEGNTRYFYFLFFFEFMNPWLTWDLVTQVNLELMVHLASIVTNAPNKSPPSGLETHAKSICFCRGPRVGPSLHICEPSFASTSSSRAWDMATLGPTLIAYTDTKINLKNNLLLYRKENLLSILSKLEMEALAQLIQASSHSRQTLRHHRAPRMVNSHNSKIAMRFGHLISQLCNS